VSSRESDLLDGFAVLLATETDPTQNVVWQPSGLYTDPAKTPIFTEDVPANPDRIVTLSLYGLGDDAVYGDSTRGLQIRTRGGNNPDDVRDLDAALCDVLVGRWPMTVGGVQVLTLVRSSGVSLGKDDSQRWSRTSNFTLALHLPGSHRL
jgi:hypothetical protein